MKRLILAALLILAAAPTLAAAQPRDYAAEARRNSGDAVDNRPGYVWRHDGHGWLQEPAASSQVLSSAPEPGCFDPYDLGQCLAAHLVPVTFFQGGLCYQADYASFVIKVAAEGPALDGIRRLVAAEWVPSPAHSSRGPVSFYADAPMFPFYAADCPIAGTE